MFFAGKTQNRPFGTILGSRLKHKNSSKCPSKFLKKKRKKIAGLVFEIHGKLFRASSKKFSHESRPSSPSAPRGSSLARAWGPSDPKLEPSSSAWTPFGGPSRIWLRQIRPFCARWEKGSPKGWVKLEHSSSLTQPFGDPFSHLSQKGAHGSPKDGGLDTFLKKRGKGGHPLPLFFKNVSKPPSLGDPWAKKMTPIFMKKG